MNRKPPKAVRQQLRREVGFGCPVRGCGNPYLYWHHFNPPWRVQQHHNPEGMIALCGEHHDKADAGAYTPEQLHEFKRSGAQRAEEVKGRFDWMRYDLLAVVGGNFYYRTPVIFQFRNNPIIWFTRDDDGYLLLNVRMLTLSSEPRIKIEDNFWLSRGNPEDLESPPSGKLLHVKYSNEDMLKVQFFELHSASIAQKHYPEADLEEKLKRFRDPPFPVTAVEVHNSVGGTNLAFGPRHTRIGGGVITNSFFADNRGGITVS